MRIYLLLTFVFAALISFAQTPAYVPTNGLVGWWGFNGNANDESGNGNNGTVNGATLTTDRDGNIDAAYSFNNSSIVCANSNIPDNLFTLSAWIYQNQSFGGIEYICLGSSSNTRWGAISSPLSTNMNYGRGCSGSGGSDINPMVNLNNWLHVVYVSQGEGLNTDIYINGTLVGTTVNNTTGSCSTTNLYFGVDIFSAPEYIDGKLDDIGIWNRALTPCEISELYYAENLDNAIASISDGGLALCDGGTVDLQASGFCALDTASAFSYMGTFSGNNYYVSNGTYTWSQSNALAAQYDADILTITSAAENTFVYDSIQSFPGTNLWLGLYGPDNSSFGWINGEPLVYTNWASGEPSSSSEDFAEYFDDLNGTWNDVDTLIGSNPRLMRLVLEVATDCGNTYLWSTSETTSQISVDQTGEYSVIITDQNGCLAYDTVTVYLSEMNIQAQDTTICPGDSVQLVASTWSLLEEFTLVADEDPPDSYTFNSANTTGSYVLVVSGTFAGSSNEERDAAYFFTDMSGNPVVPPVFSVIWDWNGVSPLTQSTMSPTDYNPEHVYYFYFDGGASQTISMFPDPGATGDNSGSLTFQVYEIDGNVLWSTGETNDTIYVNPTETTTYSVSMNYGSEICEDSITVYVLPTYNDTTTVVSCDEYVWTQNGELYSSSGFYYDSLTTANGCDSIFVLNLTVGDNEPPVNTCFPTVFVTTSDDGIGDCFTTAQVDAPGASDNCGIDTSLAYVGASLVNVNTFSYPIGTTEIMWVTFDDSGNSDTCYQYVEVTDDEDPVLQPGAPLSIQVDNDPGQCGAVVTFTSPAFTDNCSFTVTQNGGFSGDFFDVGVTQVSWVATDIDGNWTSYSIFIVVDDIEEPAFTGCPNDTILFTSSNTGNDTLQCGVQYFFPQPDVNDNCPGTTLQELGIPTNNFFDVGLTVVSWIATDTTGNADTCSFYVQVVDDRPPVFTFVPQDISLELGQGTCDQIVNWSGPFYFDDCGATIVQTAGIVEGGLFPLGTTYNEFVITDPAGLTDTCSFTVTITDTTKPVIVCPSDIVVNNVGPNCGAQIVNYSPPSSSDDCSSVTNQQIAGLPSGSIFPLGVTLNTFIATDDFGNTDTCSFTITVNDPLPPPVPIDTIFGPIEICDDINAWYNIAPVANATDANWTIVGGELTSPQPQGSTIWNRYIDWVTPGNNQVIVEAFNICYSVFDTLDVTVYEAPYPVDAGPDSTTLCEPVTSYALQAIPPTVGVGTWSVLQGGATVVDPLDPNSLAINLTDTNIFRWTVVNEICVRYSDILVMLDQTGPVALCNDTIAYMPAAGFFTLAPSQIDAGSYDNCYIQSMELSNSIITCASGNLVSTSLIVTDSIGNSSSCVADVTIIDTIPPTAICQNITIQLDAFGEYTMDPQAINGGSVDNCYIQDVLASQTFFNCTNVGDNSVTLTIVDGSGNTDTCNAVVTVLDSNGPSIGNSACVGGTFALDSNGIVMIDPYDLFAVGQVPDDPCGIASVTLSDSLGSNYTEFNCDDVGPNIVFITVTDANGNSSQCSALVTVIDNMAPVAICKDTTIILQSSESYFIAPNGFLVDGGSYDNCQITYGDLYPAYLDCANEGQNTVTMEIIDENMNSSSCDAVITLVYSISSVSDTVVCDSLLWNGQLIDTSGSYSYTSFTTGGCDSTANINVIVNYSDFHVDVITACDSYTWIDGVTYSSSTNTPIVTYTNLSGCDSTIALDLTINTSNSGSASITACDSYTWSANGTTYTSSGSFTEVLSNAEGCDSTATLNLTINYANSGSASITACDSYTWSANGTTYTSSGSFTEVLTNVQGCDSTATLNLTINYASSGSATETVCDSYTAPDGAVYTSTGMYTAIIPNAAGCDSTITIDLTVNNATASSISETALDSYTAPSGAVYTTSGVFNDTIANAAGCDSVITITLTMNHTGIEELNHQQIILTPNPTSDFITIEGIENVTGIKGMELLSSAGRVVAELKVGTVKIDVSTLSSGTYFLSITHANGTERLRFVKE